ncbi:hypothetical protein OF83DRAFT_1037694, partial [Amylostereum chailletii]
SGSDTDEGSARGRKTYVRITPIWRSRPFSNWMWSLDDIVLNQRMPRVGTRAVPGAEPRLRKQSTCVNMEAVAPPGLYRNCYDSAWVDSLLNYNKRNLHMVQLDYDL